MHINTDFIIYTLIFIIIVSCITITINSLHHVEHKKDAIKCNYNSLNIKILKYFYILILLIVLLLVIEPMLWLIGVPSKILANGMDYIVNNLLNIFRLGIIPSIAYVYTIIVSFKLFKCSQLQVYEVIAMNMNIFILLCFYFIHVKEVSRVTMHGPFF